MRAAAFLATLFLAASAQAFDACKPNAAADYKPIATESAHAIFFRIERCGQPTSYLLGSIHSDQPEARNRAGEAFGVLKQIAAAGFEYIEPADAAQLATRMMFDPRPDAKLSKQLTGTQWQILRERLRKRRGLEDAAIERLKPWAAAVMLQIPPTGRNGQILDDLLRDQAGVQGARLFGLETMESQLTIFDGMPEAQQMAMLKDSLSSLSTIDLTNTKLMKAYVAGDLATIQELGEQGFAEIKDPALRNYLQNALITQRNARMVEKMELALTGEPVLIVVGALHLPGHDGILQRMERAGYYLFPISHAVPASGAKPAAGPAPAQGH